MPNTGTPFQPSPGINTGAPIINPTVTSSVAPAPNIPGAVPIEQAGAILKQKLAEKQQAQPKQQQIPTGKSAGGAIARAAAPMPGVSQVGEIGDSLEMDWLGESHPSSD